MLSNPESGVTLAPRLLRGSAIAEPDFVYKLHGARYQRQSPFLSIIFEHCRNQRFLRLNIKPYLSNILVLSLFYEDTGVTLCSKPFINTQRDTRKCEKVNLERTRVHHLFKEM